MRTDNGAKPLASLEPNTNQSADPPAPTEPQAACTDAPGTPTGNVDDSKPLEKPIENGHPAEEVQENGARAAAEAREVVLEAAEVAVDAPASTESFGEAGESQEPLEAAEGVLAWAPEEDHEHKRVKVCLHPSFALYTFLL